jgi:SnoaL-like domain
MRNKTLFLCGLIGVSALSAGGHLVAAERPATSNRKLEQLQAQMDGLLDREAIRQLPAIYCHYVRTKNIDGIVSLFTADGELILSGNIGQGGGAKGTEALKAFYEKSIAGADPWPFTHNHYIEMLGGGKAKGYVYVEIRYGSQNFRTTVIGVYEDQYVKEGGVWKIQSRKFTGTPVPA